MRLDSLSQDDLKFSNVLLPGFNVKFFELLAIRRINLGDMIILLQCYTAGSKGACPIESWETTTAMFLKSQFSRVCLKIHETSPFPWQPLLTADINLIS